VGDGGLQFLRVNGLKRCTHSLMSGPAGMTHINSDYRYLEFCNSSNHNTAPEPTATNPGATSDWGQIVSACSNIVAPNAGGQNISSDFSQLANMANNGLYLNMIWYF